jgi:adenosylcobinamide-phosphate synthase
MSDLVPVLVLALLLDVAIGDPVVRWHPVALFGVLMERLLALAPSQGRAAQFAFGAAALAFGAGTVAVASAAALYWIGGVSELAGVIAGGMLLKISLSYRQLDQEARGIAVLLETTRLSQARVALRALVSRDTHELAPAQAASAAVESLAENLSDSFVAPLFYCVLFGVPGALAYRAVNTLDAMIGYHGQFEYLGRAAAKLDDALNFLPARLTAAILVVAAALAGFDARRAGEVGLRDHGLTASPNAGWPMATMAGALHTHLEKVGHYQLGDASIGLECTPRTIREAVRVARWGAGLAAACAMAAAIALPGSAADLWIGA